MNLRVTASTRRHIRESAREALRLWQAWLATFALLALVWWVAPQQIPLIAYKCAFIGTGGLGGYWLDRWTFPAIRAEIGDVERRHAMYRRAGLMIGGMLAAGLGA
ncbi:MAG: hypothetical protein IT519_16735 [Burkholderiales bacterium]|nr:hypothetical protein [Burkholderiales bacterium]